MGSGKAEINIDLTSICKIIAVILCAVCVALNSGLKRIDLVSNSFFYATGAFIIVIAIFLGWSLIEEEVEETYAGFVIGCGGIFNVGAGIGVIIFYLDYKKISPEMQLIAGCLELAAGITMIVDALHSLGTFG